MKQQVSITFLLMSVLFVVCLITSNLLETKVIDAGPLTLTGGLLVFPISYVLNDCIAEVWGYKKTRLIIWCGFAMNLFVVLIGLLAVQLPAPAYWEDAEHFNFIFTFAPRITLASMIAFLSGSFINAIVMSKMKLRHGEKHFSLRAILSTIAGEGIDSLLFFPIAFGGVIPFVELLKIMGIQVFLKTLYEIIILPITRKVVKKVKEREGVDVYDSNISYNILKVRDLD